MKKYLAVVFASALMAAGGCATVDTKYVESKKAAAANGEPDLLTGSRLVKPTTERVVKSVGNNEYNETNKHTSIGNALGAKSN